MFVVYLVSTLSFQSIITFSVLLGALHPLVLVLDPEEAFIITYSQFLANKSLALILDICRFGLARNNLPTIDRVQMRRILHQFFGAWNESMSCHLPWHTLMNQIEVHINFSMLILTLLSSVTFFFATS
ncbi:hypothetical protein LIER_22302 [Lithospermum erythrorhizon]|uniref:Uncharacterized protein n=1 Tax=Lithospermum erythrorhizon TaxID=34254 RepID=A0AAV3QUN7_LITER